MAVGLFVVDRRFWCSGFVLWCWNWSFQASIFASLTFIIFGASTIPFWNSSTPVVGLTPLQIPISDTATSDVFSDNDSLITPSDEDITDVTSGNNATEITSKCNVIENASTVNGNIRESSAENSNVMANTSIAKENTSESDARKSSVMESTSIIKENTSNTKKSDVKENASKSESDEHTNSLTNSGVNLVRPGSSLNSGLLSGGAEVPFSFAGDLNSLSADLVSSGPGLVSVLPSALVGSRPPFFFW